MSDQLNWEEYNGWMIYAAKQVHYPPYLDYYALAKRKKDNKIEMFNVEGQTLEEAIRKIKDKIIQKNMPKSAAN